MFKALWLENADGFKASVAQVDEAGLPAGDLDVAVAYSTLNYKDALAITNKSPVVRLWPMVAGIDGAGTVTESTHPNWKAGDKFVHNGWGLGVSIPVGPMSLALSYARETHDSETVGLRDGKTSAFGVQAIYPLSKRTRLYTSYVGGKSQNAAVAGAATSTKTSVWNVGMQHDF